MNSASALATGINRAREWGASPSTSLGSSWRSSSPCSLHDAVSTGLGAGGPIQITVRRASGAKGAGGDISAASRWIETVGPAESSQRRTDRARRARIYGDATDDAGLEAYPLVAGTDRHAGFCGQHHRYIDGAFVPQPSVISINSAAASLAVTMMLSAVTGVPVGTRNQRIRFEAGIVSRVAVDSRTSCPVCSPLGALGRADSFDPPGRR